jgi:hypothetical protein
MDIRIPNRLMVFSFLAVAVHLLGGCPSPTPVVPTVDATDASTGDDATPDGKGTVCARACATLKNLGCPEAEMVVDGDSCVDLCQKTQASRKFDMKPACILDAGSVEQLLKCGTVRCKK